MKKEAEHEKIFGNNKKKATNGDEFEMVEDEDNMRRFASMQLDAFPKDLVDFDYFFDIDPPKVPTIPELKNCADKMSQNSKLRDSPPQNGSASARKAENNIDPSMREIEILLVYYISNLILLNNYTDALKAITFGTSFTHSLFRIEIQLCNMQC